MVSNICLTDFGIIIFVIDNGSNISSATKSKVTSSSSNPCVLGSINKTLASLLLLAVRPFWEDLKVLN